MAYSIPPYIDDANVDTPELGFTWDDWKASDLYEYDSEPLAEKLLGLTPRAQIAIGIGIYEWIVWRFHSVCDDPTPYQLAEAAWCGLIKPKYMEYIELPRRSWMGPVLGPLWCAVTWMVPMVFHEDEDVGVASLESGLVYLPALAFHVLPDPTEFDRWLNVIVPRLLQLYPAEEEDVFSNLFGEKDTGGPNVPREALNPNIDFKPEQTKKLVAAYFKGLSSKTNPFLKIKG